MAKFKGIVQTYDEFTVEAVSQVEAKVKIKAAYLEVHPQRTGRFTVNEPKNLDKAQKVRSK